MRTAATMSTSVVHDSMDSGTNFVNTRRIDFTAGLLYSTSFFTYVSSIKRLKRIQSDKTSLENGKHVKFDCVSYLGSLEECRFC